MCVWRHASVRVEFRGQLSQLPGLNSGRQACGSWFSLQSLFLPCVHFHGLGWLFCCCYWLVWFYFETWSICIALGGLELKVIHLLLRLKVCPTVSGSTLSFEVIFIRGFRNPLLKSLSENVEVIAICFPAPWKKATYQSTTN